MTNPTTYIPKIAGIGIICGLDFQINSDCSIVISEGCGMTSHGHMIYFPGRHLKYFRPYEKEVRGLVTEQSEVEVWELMDVMEGDGQPLSPQEIQTERFTDDKVLFLYLEEQEECIIRPLVIDKEELWGLLKGKYKADHSCLLHRPREEEDVDLFDFGEEEVFSGQRYFFQVNRNTGLGPVEVMRFGFAGLEKECDPKEQFFSIDGIIPQGQEQVDLFLSVSEEFKILIEQVVGQLEECIGALHSKIFHDLIPKNQRFFLDAYLDFLIHKRWPGFYRNEPTKYHIQYFWDFCCGLAATYNELVQELCRLMAECGQQRGLFPYHLLLGELTEDIGFGPSVFRTHFRQPPIYNDNAERLEKIRFLHWRMAMMIKCFYIPGVEPNDIADDHFAQIRLKDDTGLSEDKPELRGDIKITPAKAYGLPLDSRTIPFYYYTAKDPNSIVYFWDFEAIRCGSPDLLFSYHADEGERHTTLCSVKQPFSHEVRAHPFYRIEGHIGDQLNDVMVRLMELRQDYNLEFDILPVALEELLFLIDDAPPTYSIFPFFRGAEHLAGVERGGTFLLVYENQRDENNCLATNPVRLDLSLSASCCVGFKQMAWYQKRILIKGKVEYEESADNYKPAPGKRLAVSYRRPGYENAYKDARSYYWTTTTGKSGTFCFALTPNYTGPLYSKEAAAYSETNLLYGSRFGQIFSPYVFLITDPSLKFIPNQVILERILEANGAIYKRGAHSPKASGYYTFAQEEENRICARVTTLNVKLFVDDMNACFNLFHQSGLKLNYGEIQAIIQFYSETFYGYRLSANELLILYKLEEASSLPGEARAYELLIDGLESPLLRFVSEPYDEVLFNFTDQFCALFEKIVVSIQPCMCGLDYVPFISPYPNTYRDPNRPALKRGHQLQFNLLELLIRLFLSRAALQSLGPKSPGLDPKSVLSLIGLKLGELPPGWEEFDARAIFKSWQSQFQGRTNPLYLDPALSLSPRKIDTAAEAKQALAIARWGLFDDGYYGRMHPVMGALLWGYLEPTGHSRWSITYNASQKDIHPGNGAVLSLWNCIYLTAIRCTRLIHRVGELLEKGNIDEESHNRIVGEAYCLRALAHFDALRFWGYFWIAGTDNVAEYNKYGVPLYTTIEGLYEENLERATVEEVYDAIFEDLEYAKNNAPSFTDLIGEMPGTWPTWIANKETAQALLARAYLYRYGRDGEDAHLASAIAEADEVINSGAFHIEADYKDIFEKGRKSEEVIFAAHYDKPQWLAQEYYYSAGGRYEYRPTTMYSDIFDSEGDSRKGASISFDTNNEPYEVKKYREVDGQNAPAYVLRYAEVILIKAEALWLRGPNEAEVLDLLNQLRERAGIAPFGSMAEITPVTLLAERRRELACEGSHEWWDGIRRNEIPDDIAREKYVLPIPQCLLEWNDKLEQNPGYGSQSTAFFANLASTLAEVQPPTAAAPTATMTPPAGTGVARAITPLTSPDDLTRIKGIGPKIGEVLAKAGIDTFHALADTPINKLKEILEAEGPPLANYNPSSWAQQASLARDGKWDELEELQRSL